MQVVLIKIYTIESFKKNLFKLIKNKIFIKIFINENYFKNN